MLLFWMQDGYGSIEFDNLLKQVNDRGSPIFIHEKGKYQNGDFFGKVTAGVRRGMAAAGAGGEFVEGWLVAQVLGEGAYGEVRLLVHARSGARWAAGGELFERIAPDEGMPPSTARRYWRQLAAGLRYLHARGVAHRDIKPENLLLDHHDNVKISDFGMATLYRHGSRERLLSRVCGTLPYAAPEVHEAARRPYRAPPADVWAAGIVLLAMLAGELPWERAVPADPRYASWSRWAAGADAQPPPPGVWSRVPAEALRWLRRALQPDASRRAPLADLLLDRWMADTPLQNYQSTAPATVAEIYYEVIKIPKKEKSMGSRGCLSQPAGGAGGDADCDAVDGASVRALSAADMDALLSCSQPASADDLLLCSQRGPLPTTPNEHSELANVDLFGVSSARRMARVCLAGDEACAWRALLAALPRAGCTPRRLDARTLAVECGAGLRMRAWIAHAGAGSTEEFHPPEQVGGGEQCFGRRAPNQAWRTPRRRYRVATVTDKLRAIELDPFGDTESTWSSLKDTIHSVVKTLPKSNTCHRKPWISPETWVLIEEQRILKQNGIINPVNKDQYRALHNKVKHNCRRDRNADVNKVCSEIEKHANSAHTKDLFMKIRTLTGEFKPRTWIVDDEKGQPITEIDKVLERWRAYTEQLYREDGQPLIRRWESHELEPDVLLIEVEHAISRLKNNAVGSDQIPANLLKSLGSEDLTLHRHCVAQDTVMEYAGLPKLYPTLSASLAGSARKTGQLQVFAAH
ncbi:protein kinase domain-containing protein [Phthorimaea operculella]|nr:protein kinase domain-containing protein [Phthorimaea operculella]